MSFVSENYWEDHKPLTPDAEHVGASRSVKVYECFVLPVLFK